MRLGFLPAEGEEVVEKRFSRLPLGLNYRRGQFLVESVQGQACEFGIRPDWAVVMCNGTDLRGLKVREGMRIIQEAGVCLPQLRTFDGSSSALNSSSSPRDAVLASVVTSLHQLH